jgi:hypothetical protein
MRYRRKPLEVEVWRVSRGYFMNKPTLPAPPEWVDRRLTYFKREKTFILETEEGLVELEHGDCVIRYGDDKIAVVTRPVFDALFEPIEESEQAG